MSVNLGVLNNSRFNSRKGSHEAPKVGEVLKQDPNAGLQENRFKDKRSSADAATTAKDG